MVEGNVDHRFIARGSWILTGYKRTSVLRRAVSDAAESHANFCSCTKKMEVLGGAYHCPSARSLHPLHAQIILPYGPALPQTVHFNHSFAEARHLTLQKA